MMHCCALLMLIYANTATFTFDQTRELAVSGRTLEIY